VQNFFATLESADFSLESKISEDEANEAITLFSVANILLGGSSQRKVGNEEKSDVLGALTLFYGLQDKSLTSKIVLNTEALLSRNTQKELGKPSVLTALKELRDQLDLLGEDAVVIAREARRQFNLGRNNDVTGNVEFPKLFARYVDAAADPLLTLDLRKERDSNQLADKEKIGRGYDLLRELKGVILQIVRSLSKGGTIATRQANLDWAEFENQALKVLDLIATERVSDDLDDKNPWSVLADLTGKSRDGVIAPYVALARNGGRLLLLAMDAYLREKDAFLDKFDDDHLSDLFQSGGDSKNFLTTLMRAEATVIKRYPLANWA